MPFATAVRSRVEPLFSPGAMSPYDPCHDAFHVGRVAKNAVALAGAEGADVDVVECAAWLHDLDRTGEPDPLGAARAHLAAVGAPEAFAARVLEAVERHKDKSFSAGGVRPRSVEAAVLSDADKLEAIGAIGVARAFSFGGLKGRALWDGNGGVWGVRPPTSSLEMIRALEEAASDSLYVSGAGGSTIDHFFQKLLRIEGDLVTPAGRAWGKQRTEFLRAFLAQFFAEWDAAMPPGSRNIGPTPSESCS